MERGERKREGKKEAEKVASDLVYSQKQGMFDTHMGGSQMPLGAALSGSN